MTTAFFCVLIASILPIIWTGVAKNRLKFNLKDNHRTREVLANATGVAQRANWAQQNSWEAFAPFAAAVIIASIAKVTQSKIDTLAVTFIISRILYGIFYITDQAILRSLVWFVGFASTVGMYYLVWSMN